MVGAIWKLAKNIFATLLHVNVSKYTPIKHCKQMNNVDHSRLQSKIEYALVKQKNFFETSSNLPAYVPARPRGRK